MALQCLFHGHSARRLATEEWPARKLFKFLTNSPPAIDFKIAKFDSLSTPAYRARGENNNFALFCAVRKLCKIVPALQMIMMHIYHTR